MPRAYRHLTITFGLVTVPVSIAPLTSEGGIRGKTVCARHRSPVKRQWACPDCAEGVAHDTETAYEVEGQYVVPELPEVEKDAAIGLRSFVPAADIDPVLFDSSYILWPKDKGEGFDLLAQELRETGLAAVGTVTLTKREQMAVLRFSSLTGTLVLHVCRFHADIRWGDVEAVRRSEEVDPKLAELAKSLIGTLKGEASDLGMLEDGYTVKLTEAIQAAAKGQKPKRRAKTKTPAAPPEILDALKASMNGAAVA
jgi:DNA end-binding protein Ku